MDKVCAGEGGDKKSQREVQSRADVYLGYSGKISLT